MSSTLLKEVATSDEPLEKSSLIPTSTVTDNYSLPKIIQRAKINIIRYHYRFTHAGIPYLAAVDTCSVVLIMIQSILD